jgi:hypothetical protein
MLAGTAREVVEQAVREAGMALEMAEPRTRAEREWMERFRWFGEGTPLLYVLDASLAGGPYEAVLEPGRVVIMGRGKAREAWERATK